MAGTPDALQRQQIEFLAIYYHLNRLHDRLRRARHEEDCEWPESTVVADLEELIRFRDELEDQCAVIGFDAEPVMSGHLVVDVCFSHARKHPCENHRRRHPQEARIKVPMPDPAAADVFRGIAGIPPETILADLRVDRVASRVAHP